MDSSILIVPGLIVILGIIVGLIAPTVFIVQNAKSLSIGGNIDWKNIVRSIFLLSSSGKLLKTENITVKGEINILAYTYNSVIKINEWDKDFVEVKINNIEPFPLSNIFDIKTEKPEYKVVFIEENYTLTIKSHNTYIQVNVPKSSIKSLIISNDYGALSAVFTADKTERIDITTEKGGVNLDLKSLTNTSIKIKLQNSGIDLKASYIVFTGKSTIDIDAVNTLVSISIKKPAQARIKLSSSLINSALNAEYNGQKLSSNYVDKEYEQANTKIEILFDLNGSDTILDILNIK